MKQDRTQAMDMKAGYDEARRAFRGSAAIGEWALSLTLAETTDASAKATPGKDGRIEVERRITGTDGRQCLARETFTPDSGGAAKWEIEITAESDLPWTAPISLALSYPAKPATRFWSAWDTPADAEHKGMVGPWDSLLEAPADSAVTIGNPLRSSALVPITYTYGAPRMIMERDFHCWWSWGQRPRGENYFAIPIVTLIEPGVGGLSLMIAPDQVLLDMELAITTDGKAEFLLFRHRISKGTPVRLALYLKSHEDDWRPGIGWMRDRFAEFFEPGNPGVVELSGTASYSGYGGELDAEELKKMNYAFNWRASMDWPYFGLFLPPVGREEEWTPFLGQTQFTTPRPPVTMALMDDYGRRMNDAGFKVLDYFNVTEFGTAVQYPPPPPPDHDGRDVWNNLDWHDGNEFLFNRLAAALLRVPDQLRISHIRKWPQSTWARTRAGGLFYTWEEAVVLDCGEPVFRDFLLDQLRRHIKNLPHSSGICIDRLDWLRLYNLDRDDGVSWYDGKPARSLVWSWNHLMDRVGPLIHGAGKVIFASPIVKRLEMFGHVDGFLSETDDDNGGMTGLALIGMNKPTALWRSRPVPKGQEDAFMQRRLHLGIYPMCPYPENDHGVSWEPAENRQPWVDYGGMMAALKGKKWVLEPHCVEIAEDAAQANLFETLEGWVVPITFGKLPQVRVWLRNVPFLMGKLEVTVLHPGVKEIQKLQANWTGDVLEIAVPLHRDCAMLKITSPKETALQEENP